MPELFRTIERKRELRTSFVEKRGTYNLKELHARHHQILDLKFLGLSNEQVARAVGVTKQTVVIANKSSAGKEKLRMMSAALDAETFDAAKKIRELVPKALGIYEDILDNPNQPMSLRKVTADSLLKDFSGLKVAQKVEGKFLHGHVNADLVERIKLNGREAAIELGLIKAEQGSIETSANQNLLSSEAIMLAVGVNSEGDK